MMTDNIYLDRSTLLESLIKAATGSEPSNILLAGPWGSGKTTLLDELRAYMELRSGDDAPYVIWFSPWSTIVDGDPRMAFLRLLRDELKSAFDLNLVPNAKAKRWVNLIDKVLNSKLVSGVANHFTDGILLSVAGGVTSLLNELLDSPPVNKHVNDSILALRREVSGLLRSIASAKKKRNILLLVDDLDRAKPTDAIDVLDSLYHLFMPHLEEFRRPAGVTNASEDEVWPLTSIWAVNTAVLEEFLYREYRELPSFDPNAYLEKLFWQRINVPPLIEGVGHGDTQHLWERDLDGKSFATSGSGWSANDLARTLSKHVNYAILGNLRLHARVRRDCIRLWEIPGGVPSSMQAFVRGARLIVLIDAFSYFREQILPFNGMWPHFVNQINKRLTDRPMEWVANPLYRHVDSPDLATLLEDLGALSYNDSRMRYEIDKDGRDKLQQELVALWKHGI